MLRCCGDVKVLIIDGIVGGLYSLAFMDLAQPQEMSEDYQNYMLHAAVGGEMRMSRTSTPISDVARTLQ